MKMYGMMLVRPVLLCPSEVRCICSDDVVRFGCWPFRREKVFSCCFWFPSFYFFLIYFFFCALSILFLLYKCLNAYKNVSSVLHSFAYFESSIQKVYVCECVECILVAIVHRVGGEILDCFFFFISMELPLHPLYFTSSRFCVPCYCWTLFHHLYSLQFSR